MDEPDEPLALQDAREILIASGTPASEVAPTLTSMESARQIFRLRDHFYTRPDVVMELVDELLPESRLAMKKLGKEVEQIEAEHRRVEERLASVTRQAARWARVTFSSGVFFTIGQLLVFYHLTYNELSWDFTEPIVFLWGLGMEMVAISFFMGSSKMLTYSGINDMYHER